MANDRLEEVLLVHVVWLCVILWAIVFDMIVYQSPGEGGLLLAH